ncbi:MAG: molybdenum cofactor guanylyltransferase [Chromatiaceae bacterium]|nr:molybdenum cofactor guanylyltransferase [Chromatiaceae bacterium]
MSPQAPVSAREVTAVILAGGAARRMGGRDKGLLDLAGRALIDWTLAALRPQVGAILISANRHLDHYGRFGYPVLADDLDGFQGPLAGIRRAFQALRTPWLLVLPCDAPLLPADLLARLSAALREAHAPLAIAHDGTRDQPAHALLSQRLAPSLEQALADGERSLAAWQSRHPIARADFSDLPQAFANLNTPAELAALEQSLVSKEAQRRRLDATARDAHPS